MTGLEWGNADSSLRDDRVWKVLGPGMTRCRTDRVGEMKRRTPKIIQDKKERGQWAESVFTARAEENGLPVSRPFGDAKSFDCVVGRPGRFVAVQVKSTVTKLESGKGYNCSVCSLS